MNGSFAATTTHWNNAAPKIVPLQQAVELVERVLMRPHYLKKWYRAERG